MALPAPTIARISKPQIERRRVPRIFFKATSVVSEAGSSRVVIAQTTELSRLGCFVQTIYPHPQGTRVHIELAEAGTTFIASGVVAYVTDDGMGIVFNMVDQESYDILATWLSRTPRRSERHSFVATAQVKDSGSADEQVLITRDLSAGGCFIKTATPLPAGTRIHVCVEHAGAEFTAIAQVTNNVNREGMGVQFIEIEPDDKAVLEKWLAEKGNHSTKSP